VQFSSSNVATSGEWHLFLPPATVLAGCSDQGHDFLMAVEVCMGMGKTKIPWVPWDSHGNGYTISHGNGMGMGIRCMGMGIKTWEWEKITAY